MSFTDDFNFNAFDGSTSCTINNTGTIEIDFSDVYFDPEFTINNIGGQITLLPNSLLEINSSPTTFSGLSTLELIVNLFPMQQFNTQEILLRIMVL